MVHILKASEKRLWSVGWERCVCVCKMVNVAFWCKLPYLWMCLTTSITHRKAHIKRDWSCVAMVRCCFFIYMFWSTIYPIFWIYHYIKNDGFTKHGWLCKRILFFNYWKVMLEFHSWIDYMSEASHRTWCFHQNEKNSIAPSQHRCLKNLGIRICISSLQGGPDQEAGFISLQL